jgi:FMN phosphatase YigB (HAD superfamily)
MSDYKAVLFDLDGTLLDSSMDAFLPVYLRSLTARVAHLFEPKAFVTRLLWATEQMSANDGRATNQDVFMAAFFPYEGRTREELMPIFDAFYAEDFPRLQNVTRRKPEARAVVQRVQALGYDTAIVTNPLFPEAAIRHRMQWAGVDDLPFKWVTTYENSRYAKPNLRYFDDACARLGHAPEACLVVGDEHMDMVAKHIGCDTFLVEGPTNALQPSTPEPTYRGSLTDLVALLEVAAND